MGEHKFNKNQSLSTSPRKGKSFAAVIIVFLAVITVIGMDIMQREGKSPLTVFTPERTKGSPQAPLKIVEFIDFQCSHCKEGSEILRKYMVLHPEMIQLTLKYFPLSAINSSMSAYYAECSAWQGKFWEMHDAMLEDQAQWRTLLRIKPYLNKIAQGVGLNQDELDQCLESKKVKKIVAKEKATGESLFIKSTPTYFINGDMNVGIRALEGRLKEYIEKYKEPSL